MWSLSSEPVAEAAMTISNRTLQMQRRALMTIKIRPKPLSQHLRVKSKMKLRLARL